MSTPLSAAPSSAPLSAERLAELSVVFLHQSDDAGRLLAQIGALQAQHGPGIEITVLDLGGAPVKPVGCAVVKEPSLSVGPGLSRLLPTLRPTVALRCAEADFDAAALGAGLDALEAAPEADLVLSRFAIARGDGSVSFVIDPRQDGEKLPPCAEDNLLVRRSALERAERLAHHPTLLCLMQRAVRASGLLVLDQAYHQVTADRFALQRLQRQGELHLLHAHGVEYDLGEPWLSVLLVARTSSDAFARAFGSLCRQNLPLGLVEIVVVDGIGLDWLAELPVAVTVQRSVGVGQAWGANLQQALELARGVLVHVFDDNAVAMADLVERHVRAHREHPDQRLVVVGTQEAPVSEDLSALRAALDGLSPTLSFEDVDSPRIRPISSLSLHNASFTPEAALLVGGFAAELDAELGADLGWRLADYEYEVLAVPEARSIRQQATTLAGLLEADERSAKAGIIVMSRSPAAIDAAGVHTLQASELEALIDGQRGSEGIVGAALAELGALRPTALAAFGGDWAGFAAEVEARVGSLVLHLRRLAQARGRLAGLRALDLPGVPALLRASPLTLPGRATQALVLRPLAGEGLGWLSPLAHFLVNFGPTDDTTLILYADPANGGVEAETLRAGVMELTGRLTPGPRGGWADVQVLEAQGTTGELIRLLASVDGYALGADEPDAELSALAEVVGCPLQAPADWEIRFTDGVRPMPLATEARYRLLTWPDWSSEVQLNELFEQYGRALANRDDAALLIRYDGAQDGDPDDAVRRLDAAFAATMGEGWDLEVVLIDQPLDAEGLASLRAAISAVGVLSEGGARTQALEALGAAVHTDGVGVTLHLFDQPPAPFGPLYPATLSLR